MRPLRPDTCLPSATPRTPDESVLRASSWWCCSGVAVVLQWCCSGVAGVVGVSSWMCLLGHWVGVVLE